MNFQQLSNLQYWTSLFSSPWSIVTNLIDILIVTYILYHFTKAIAGTKIMILVRGVLVFILAQILSNMIGLTTISWLINQIITYGVIAAVVIFSPEIRTGLERLGRATDFFSNAPISAEEQMVRAFVKSVEYMSPRKIGALVVVQRVRTLQEYISTGIPLDAKISAELLINIFIPNTPLHDGAVIIKEDRIAVTSAYLPPDRRYRDFQGVWNASQGGDWFCRKCQMLLPLWFRKKRVESQSPIMESLSMI